MALDVGSARQAPRKDPRNTVFLSTLWNETRAAGLDYLIKPLSGLNAIDFVNRVFRKSGDVEILPRAGRSSRCCKQSRPTLDGPSQHDLC